MLSSFTPGRWRNTRRRTNERSASISARSATATTPTCWPRTTSRSRTAGRICSRRTTRAMSRSRTRTRRALPTPRRDDGADPRRGRGVQVLKALDVNINQYTKSGAAPIKRRRWAKRRSASSSCIDVVAPAVATGLPLKIVAPCEGTGYEIGSMTIIKGGPTSKTPEQWYDWALTADAQKLALRFNAYQVPSKDGADPRPRPNVDTIKLIDSTFKKFGSSDERMRLLPNGTRRSELLQCPIGRRRGVLPSDPNLLVSAWIGLPGPAVVRDRRRILLLRLAG